MTDLTVATDNPLATLFGDPEALKKYDAAQLKQMLDLQERILDRQSKQKYFTAMHTAQGDMGTVRKASKNPHTNSYYANAEDVDRMLNPVLDKHGFSVSFSEADSDKPDRIKIVMRVRHIGGHEELHYRNVSVDDRGPKGAAVKTRLHGEQSSMTYTKRTMKCDVFNIQYGNDDDGNAAAIGPAADPITEEQGFELHSLLELTGTDTAKFTEWLGVDKVTNIPQSLFNKGLSMLKRKQEKMNDEQK